MKYPSVSLHGKKMSEVGMIAEFDKLLCTSFIEDIDCPLVDWGQI